MTTNETAPRPAAGSWPGYRLPRLAVPGLLGSWNAGALATVGAALVVAVAIVRAEADVVRVVAAGVLVSAAFAAARVPLAGRTAIAWLPIVSGTLVRWANGALRQVGSPEAVETTLLRVPGHPTPPRGGRHRPVGPFQPLRLVTLPAPANRLRPGAIEDLQRGTWTAVLRLRHDAIGFADPASQRRQAEAFTAVLAGLAARQPSPVRLQWLLRRRPLSLEGFALAPSPSAPAPAVRSYQGLLVDLQQGWGYETALAICGRAAASVVDLTADATRALRGIGLDAYPLGPPGLAAWIEEAVTAGTPLVTGYPLVREGSLGAGPDGDLGPGAGPESEADLERRMTPWPLAVDEHWGSLRTDGTCHVVWWVAEWPAGPVGPNALAPLLTRCAARFTVSVVLEPVPLEVATRVTSRQLTARAADARLRRHHGFRETARSHRESDDLRRREDELAAGHRVFRLSGFVSASASTPEALEETARHVERAGAESRLGLTRLYGQQGAAFLCTLPLGRDLR